MKKSELYYLAQQAVLTATGLNNSRKLEILRELMGAEDLALFREKKEEGEAK